MYSMMRGLVVRFFYKPFLNVSPASAPSAVIRCPFSAVAPEERPFSRAFNVIKKDIKRLGKGKDVPDIIPTHCDILIVGGGVMGCSTAFWLKYRALDGLSVVVVEKDPSVMLSDNSSEKLKYLQCTSTLSVGGLRQQFSLKENIELSLKSADFFRNIKDYLSIDGQDPPDIQFHPAGYLFLAGEHGAKILEENYNLQRSLGAKVELISPAQLKERFPWMNTQGIILASLGLQNEGWFDPHSLLFAFKRKAVYMGADFLPGEVVKFEADRGSDVIIDGEPEQTYKFHTAVLKLKDGVEHRIRFSRLVIAAGGYSGEVAQLLDVGKGPGLLDLPLPVEPRKRYVFNVHCPDGPGVAAPMVIDCSGAYIRREGLLGHYLCGMSPPDEEEPPIDNLDVDYSFFEEKVWPILANRIPCLENAKLKSAWAAFYDFNRFDENGFIGPHPAFFNVYLATGFSGHGIQQSPMVGKAIMELIVDSKYSTIDLERLGYNRYLQNEPLYESNIV